MPIAGAPHPEELLFQEKVVVCCSGHLHTGKIWLI